MHIAETLFGEVETKYTKRIYFGYGINGQIKVGLTGRQNGHRGGEMHFTELCSVPGDMIIEHRYHTKYARERIGKTEWFALSDRLLLDLVVMCVQQGRWQSVDILKTLVTGRMAQAAA